MNKNAWNLILLLMVAVLAVKCKGLRPLSEESAVTVSLSKEEKLRHDIVEFAKKYEGASYKYGGTTPKGFDCSGFTLFVMNEFDVQLPRNSAAQSKFGQKIRIDRVQAGDLLFFRRKGKINHVGLVIENSAAGLFMIHSSSRGVVIDNVFQNTYWKPLLDSARSVLN